jgi:hypothetical protein
MMLIGARPDITNELTFETVRTDLTRLVDRIRASEAPPCSV